jgi:hypothetical protein
MRRFVRRLGPLHFSVVLLATIAGCPPGGSGGFGGQGASAFRGKGVPWSILCMEMSGPYAHASIERVAEVLRQVPTVRADAVFIREGSEGVVRLFYGTYRVTQDEKTGRHLFPRAMDQDAAMLKELAADTGEHYFIYARKVPTPLPDVGNPEWVLARAGGVYSLQVASFVSVDEYPNFKQAAADYCARLRSDGFEAYYWHSDDCSIVTVGSFGEDAIIEHREAVPNPIGGRASRGTYIEGQRYSERVLALQRHELFKYNYVNGHLHQFRFRDGVTSPPRSQLVRIPHSRTVPR